MGVVKSREQLWKICMDIYKKLYENAQPIVDIKKLIKSGVTKNPNWFMDYYLDNKSIKRIIDKHIKKHKLNKRDKKAVYFEVWLGASPTGNKERWEKRNDSKNHTS